MFKKEWNDRELEDVASREIGRYLSRINEEEKSHQIDTEDIVLISRMKEFAVIVADKSWTLGKKEGTFQGAFLALFLLFILWGIASWF